MDVMQTVCVKLNLGSDGCKPVSESPSSYAAKGQASLAQHSVIPAQHSVIIALDAIIPCMRLPGQAGQ